MTPERRRLLIFGREPAPGRVKTRLIPALGPAKTTLLYSYLLETALKAASGVDKASVELWCDFRDEAADNCQALATRYAMSLCRQQGEDLGGRMYHAMAAAPWPGPTLLIGSDCPEYTSAYLSGGFASLADTDAVIGPATDGGYVLIGLNRVDRRLFDGMPWGTGEVLAHTRARLHALGWRWSELPPLRDIDRPSDLAHFGNLMSVIETPQQGNHR